MVNLPHMKNCCRKNLRARWMTPIVALALASLLSCQGLSAGSSSNQRDTPSIGNLQLSRSALGFGKVVVGSSSALPITVTNNGTASVTISSARASTSEFSLSAPTLPLSVSAGETANLSIVFTPSTASDVSGTIALWSNASDTTLTLSLTGTGLAPGQVVANPNSINFGAVSLGGSQTQSATVTNSGGSNITISQATVSGTGFQLSGPSLPLTLNPGQSSSVVVTFSPQSIGAQAGILSLTTSVSTTISQARLRHAKFNHGSFASAPNVAASNDIVSISLSGSGTAAGQLSITPATLTFTNVEAGTNQSQSVTLTNSGGSSVSVSQALITGSGFSLSGISLPLSLPAGQSTTFKVAFDPRAAGRVSGSIAITSDASNSTLNLPLSGSVLAPGALSANPTSVGFGSMQIGSSQQLSATLTNTGETSVTITQASISGTGLSLNSPSLPMTLAAGQSANFKVVFQPRSTGKATGSLTITSNAPNPTLTIPVSGIGTSPGLLSANPTSLGFGSVQVGNSKQLSQVVTNTGGSNVTISQYTISGSGFNVSGFTPPLTLTPGQSSTFTVTYAPQSAGAPTGNISVASNASNANLTIPLSGTGTTAGQLTSAPTSVGFSNVQVGTSQSQTVTLSNSGGSTVSISQALITGSGFSLSGMSVPVTLAAGQSTTFQVSFVPQAAGTASGNIALSSGGSNSTLNVPLSGTALAPGFLTANPTSVAFGSVQVGNSQQQSATLTNTGGASVTITQASISGTGLTLNGPGLPLTLAANQSANLKVIFQPQSSGSTTGTITITSNAPNSTLTIPISGSGTTPGVLNANPTSLSFGSVQVGNSTQLSQVVTNAGGSSVTISQYTVTGSGFGVSGFTPPLTLAPGQSYTFTVNYTPQSTGAATGNVSILSTASVGNLTIPLSGTGTAAGQLTVSPAALNFSNVVVGTSASQSASLTAAGSSVTVTSANLGSSEFSVSGISFPVSIPAGNSASFTVTFTPQSTGAANSTLSFASNASSAPTVQSLAGTGSTPPVHTVVLSWTASTSSTVSSYNVYRSTTSGGPYSEIGSVPEPTTTFTDTSVTDGQTYYYVTTTVNSSGQESSYSKQATAVIPPP